MTLNEIQTSIEKEHPYLNQYHRILIAVSGGLDSRVLMDVLYQMGFDITVAHCNFNLRGEESDTDARFVSDLAANYQCAYFETTFDTVSYAKEKKVSIQMAARELRYEWFDRIISQEHLNYIATAHHLDDSIETFFINLGRGTGLNGLTGIPLEKKYLIRPLLSFSKYQILNYAKKHQLQWREDSSNMDDKYLRNHLRHQVIPHLKKVYPQFEDSFLKTISHLTGSKQILERHISAVKENLFKSHPYKYEIIIKELQELKPLRHYLRALFHSYGFTQYDDIKQLLTNQSGKYILSPTHRLVKSRHLLILEPIPKKSIRENIYFFDDYGNLILEELHLLMTSIKKIPDNGYKAQTTIYIDAKKINHPLFLRKWKRGDRFYPYGMGGQSKKISTYFKDEKYNISDKERQWLLCCGDKIVWVVGRRADERFKIDRNHSKEIFKIQLKNPSVSMRIPR